MAAILAAILSLASPSSEAAEAPVLPRASESTLLDIVRAGERLVVVGEYGHVLYTDDKGASWIQARVPTRQMLTAVYFLDEQRGWAVGHDGLILASINAGETWTIQRDGLLDQRRIDQARLDQLKKGVRIQKERLLVAESTAERSSLQLVLEEMELDLEDAEWALSEPVQPPPLLDIFFIDGQRGLATGAFNTLLLTGDGGSTWTDVSVRLHNPDEYHLNAITGDELGNLWIAAEGGLLFRSLDAGASWQSLPSPYGASWFGIVRAPQSGTLLGFGLRGTVFRSIDQGDSWQRSESNTHRTISGGVFLNENYALLAGSVGILLFSEDGGTSFRPRALESRVNLSSVLCVGDEVIAVGQGGVHRDAGFGDTP